MGRSRKGEKQPHAQIVRLFELAAARALERPDLAKRYVSMARKMASRSRTSLRTYNRVHCRECCAYFTSKTLRVRTRPTSVVYTCLSCGAVRRYRTK